MIHVSQAPWDFLGYWTKTAAPQIPISITQTPGAHTAGLDTHAVMVVRALVGTFLAARVVGLGSFE